VLKMRLRQVFCSEGARHSLSCIAMQRPKNHQGRFSGVWTGKAPETARTPQDRAEGLSGGAGKRCYGKLDSLQESVFVSLFINFSDYRAS
jgi:hypothetical protein